MIVVGERWWSHEGSGVRLRSEDDGKGLWKLGIWENLTALA